MVLKNNTARMRVYTLPHAEVCESECLCVSTPHLQGVLDPSTGERGVREVSVRVPKAVHIPGRGLSEDLPAAVLKCKRIAADIDSGLLSVKGN
jgi:hypothetical protein